MARLPAKYCTLSPIGEELKFDHEECGDTRGRLFVRRLRGGWMYCCHNCGPDVFAGFQSGGEPSPADILRSLEEAKRTAALGGASPKKEIFLPSDFSTLIPPKGLTWLYKYDLTDSEIKRYGFGFSDRLNRLILPVYMNDRLVYWQGRNLGKITKENPKYLNITSNAKDVYFLVKKKSKSIAIVEDIVSAVKVGRHVDTLALLGSYMTFSILKYLSEYDTIYVWLDYDKMKANFQYTKKLSSLTGKRVIPVLTTQDPKELEDETIKEVLCR